MKLKAEVVDYVAKAGVYEGRSYQTKTLILQDRTEGVRLLNPVEFVMTEEQAGRLPSHEPSKLQGLSCEVGIRDLMPGQNGRMRCRGELMLLNGKPVS